MADPEQEPQDRMRVCLPFEVEEPFGILDFATEDVIYETPFLPAKGLIDGESVDLYLHWFNTTVRTFSNNVDSSHIDYRNPDDRLQGIKLSDDILDLMLEYDYPHHNSPFIDDASVKWLSTLAMGNLDDELDELQDES